MGAESQDMTDLTGAAAAAASGFALSPYCVHLQSKKLFFRKGPPMQESDVLDASRHCWCSLTMQVLGADGEVVHPDECQTGRSCFRSIL